MRHRAEERVDPAATGDRLAAMSLRSGGWVPDRPGSAPEPAQPLVMPRAPLRRPQPPSMGELARDWAQDRLPLGAQGLLARVTLGSLVTGGVCLASVVVVAVAVLDRHSASEYSPPSYASGPPASATTSYADPVTTTAPSAVTDATSIVVDVGGRVRKPGLVTLPPGARVNDAIQAAGGPLRHRELAAIDLAARVTDGQLLLVGVKAPAAGGVAPTAASSTAPVSINSATLEELETLPGVGPVTAQKILDWRTAHSGFTSIEQLQQVSGIGPATYAELAPAVTL
jgi:competence protein ComEA